MISVHHIEGHIAANFIEHKELESAVPLSGGVRGHTHLVCVKDYGEFEILGRTKR